MRILHVDTGGEMRGGQWQCLHLASAQGSDATLLAASGGPLARAARERGITVEALNIARLAVLARGVDVVHAHDARAHTWAVAAGGAPVVVSRRVAFPVRRSMLSRWKYALPAHYIAVSQHVCGLLVEAGVPHEKISVVYDGVELPAEQARPERIVALDSVDPLKGSALLREAAAGRFEVCFSRDLAADLPAASVFVYITHSEGLGSAALLAQAWGVPVVASRVGGLPEAVEDGVTGVLTDNEPQEIAAAVSQVLARREELSRNARARIESRFTIEHMAHASAAVYRKVLAC